MARDIVLKRRRGQGIVIEHELGPVTVTMLGNWEMAVQYPLGVNVIRLETWELRETARRLALL